MAKRLAIAPKSTGPLPLDYAPLLADIPTLVQADAEQTAGRDLRQTKLAKGKPALAGIWTLLRPGQARSGVGVGGQSGLVGALLGHLAADSGPATAGGARQLDVYPDQCPFPEIRVLPLRDSQPGAVTLINFVMRTEVDQEQGFPAGFGIFLTGKDDPTVIAGGTGVETF